MERRKKKEKIENGEIFIIVSHLSSIFTQTCIILIIERCGRQDDGREKKILFNLLGLFSTAVVGAVNLKVSWFILIYFPCHSYDENCLFSPLSAIACLSSLFCHFIQIVAQQLLIS